MNKMKVWECKIDRGLLLFQGDFPPESVEFDQATANYECIIDDDWKETTRYEITERKPDYLRMAKNWQFGYNGCNAWGYLFEYNADDVCPFKIAEIRGRITVPFHRWSNFIPYAEPVELDPLTMQPKEPDK